MLDDKRLLVTFLVCILTVSSLCYAQTAKPDAPKAQSQPCAIVARHVHKFGENMSRLHPHRPFDYVEGAYPSGFKWRSELSDGDVRELQQKGERIVILKPDYQASDLEDARKQCQAQTPK
jgi:hypothetical protein